MTIFSRRHFVKAASLAVLGAPVLRAVEPFARAGGPRLRLGLAAYSFRDYFQHSSSKQEPVDRPRTLTMEKFLDHCAEWGVDGAELTSYYFPPDATTEHFAAVRRHAHLAGVTITGTSVGNTFTHPPGPQRDKEMAYVKQWIDNAVALGAPHIRVFAGNQHKSSTLDEAKKLCIAALEECGDYAGKHGIFLGIENHHGIVAEAEHLVDIVRAVKSPWVGINMDTGNFRTDDPYGDLARIAPFAVNVQIKTELQPRGAKEKQPADLARLVGIVRDAGYRGWVTLEFEEKTDPWTRVPQVLAQLRPLIGAGQQGEAGAKGEPAWQRLFDGRQIGKWKHTDFAGKADIEIADGQLIIPRGGEINGVNLEAAPAEMNYEVQFDAMRVEGGDFFVGFTFPVGKTHVTFVAGGWGGTVTGISSINGDAAIENETCDFINYENGKWYHFRVKVTPAKIEVWMDDKQVVNLETEGKELGMRAGEIEISKPFGFATFSTKAALKNIEWRPLSK